MEEQLVSIGVPVYNGDKFLEECLESIRIQTYRNWECVIVDNCSKDDTHSIAEKFQRNDKRFRLIKNDAFVDQTTNWNISYSKSNRSAKYFKIVCADDWLFPEYLEKMVAVMEAHPSAGVCSSYRIDGNTVNCDKLDYYSGSFHRGTEILVKQLLRKFDVTGSINTVLYRNDVLEKVNKYPMIFQDGTYHIDTELAYKVLSISDFCFVYQVLSYTRRHNETYTNLISNRFNTGLYFDEKELFKYIDLNPELKSKYLKIRNSYALFLLKKRINGDKECIEWHKKHMDKSRHFTSYDFIRAIVSRILN